MPYDTALADRIRPFFRALPGCVEKKMFGGIGFLLGGNMCVGVWKEFLILRLGPEQAAAALEQPGVKEFDITGKPMRGWVMVDAADLHDRRALKAWIDQAVRFVRTLPVKP